ncbi:2-hydroxyacid dehydrogenase [Tuwongella immobilis]|uniref:S-adenosyl-L-homocysteine hydrolase NAD binding domain-containing protein n=1 Tax=Tuwongella immobilis TaxID=692036 RepID=A0A6C2YKG4_9BACT|nr:2-hydroxyacid dehydrogenase [Tuwongella immobilis]VIP02070.1 d-lactate dehydrogenase : Lactate dehydrogenase-like oxidoreductase OS=Nostoc sp. (strain ATCC 29411 / PCC 7524) GN=Nos7524_3709 PE=3 SV=1: 2-Hacid_dh: 2-Hacid_dh_C [Tuwongella immobilis]VTS00297.1 d-lactate dehydrogenase : Lactate dehydrogenase-like oxidoreductase OS=Nostoc sp. (strain ATCC 29411 / PCC 7524) GN=Nos7524_3709 PE=3 SV=1: 2-Hacid_dh: 2-Hacid_dh_C [Tuwongella immobilis]
MRVAFFGTRSYDRHYFDAVNAARPSSEQHELLYLEPRLTAQTAPLAAGFPAVCVFVNDSVTADVIGQLAAGGTKVIALRCAGFNNVDLAAAKSHGITVVRVPAYAPDGVAEFAVALLLTLNRKIHKAYNRVREGNFSLDHLEGFNLAGKTVGVIGTGKIGQIFARIMLGFGCRVLAYDVAPAEDCLKRGVQYVSLDQLAAESDVISLHCPLMPATHHLVNAALLAKMKPGVMLVNTSRGGLIDTKAVIHALKTHHLGALAIDVYEEEEGVFFEDQSVDGVQDDVLARLFTFPNVLVSGHQAFLTKEALSNIASTTLDNLSCLQRGEVCANRVEKS